MMGYFSMSNLEQLLARYNDVRLLGQANAVLGWDQQCYMPHGGGAARAAQTSVLSRITHEMFTSPDMGALLAAAEGDNAGAESNTKDAQILRVLRRDYDQETKLPTDLVESLTRESMLAHEVWVDARKNDDFKTFAPTLQKLLDLVRRQADCLGYDETPYDALLDRYEPGLKSSDASKVFDSIKPVIASILAKVRATPEIDDSVLRRVFPEAQQIAFGERVVRYLGFDFNHGRQDKAVHPFCTGLDRTDVRITTRIEENWLPCALMGTMHEAGHGMYEQGFLPEDDGTPLGSAVSLGFHESQSRLWENTVGRSQAFWNKFYPELQAAFPGVLDDVSLAQFYKAINKVQPSLIRVEADEVTYNLHVLMRFELEKQLIEGTLAVKDLPDAWNAKVKEYLGIDVPNNAQGCLQDVHWSAGLIGYFPTYSVGTVLAAQLYDAALAQTPGLATDIENADYSRLLGWMRTNVHHPGRRFLPTELVEKSCNAPFSAEPYIVYLTTKYGAIYGA